MPGGDFNGIERERVERGLYRRRWITCIPVKMGFALNRIKQNALFGKAYSITIPTVYAVWMLIFSIVVSLFNILFFFAAAVRETGVRVWHMTSLRVDRRYRSRAVAAIGMFMFAVLMTSTFFLGLGFEVYLKDESIGYVKSQDDFEAAVENVEAKVSQVLGHSYFIYPEVTYRFGLFDRRNVLNQSQVEEQLYNDVSEVRHMSLLRIDGQIVGGTAGRNSLEAAVDAILQKYPLEKETDRVEFVRDVKITDELAPTEYLKDISDIESVLNSTVHDQEVYDVAEGDTISEIAAKHGMNQSALLELNPELDNKGRLKTESQLVVSAAVPYMSVRQYKQIVFDEVIPYTTENVSDSSIYKGESKVKVKGADGQVRVTADIICIDGIEKERVETNRDIIVEPVTKIVLVGTKIPPPKYPTGTFIRPFWGILTSNYGYRGREFHTGVDFAGPSGSSIVASDGGTVSFAGRKGNLGNLVIIDHKNGYQTYYGHCSKLLVSVGQQVAQGELIARVGSTGRSTGPHVHFEVRINGKYMNPWNYLKK